MTLVLELPPDVEAHLQQEAQERGVTLTDYALQRLSAAPAPAKGDVHPLLLLAERVRAAVPEAARKDLPPDFAANYEHYLHHQPKVTE